MNTKPSRENLWKGLKPFRKINLEEKKLVAALRSGRYKQTTGVLKNGNAYCCLGVACKISGIGKFSTDESCLGEVMRLPLAVREKLGWVSWSLREDKIKLPSTHLAGLNDDFGFNFKEIARVIELGLVKKSRKR
jgi:hypothetical protein